MRKSILFILLYIIPAFSFATPQWFNKIPTEKGTYYFSGIGYSEQLIEAKNQAVLDIHKQISNMIQLKVSYSSNMSKEEIINNSNSSNSSSLNVKMSSKSESVITDVKMLKQDVEVKLENGRKIYTYYILSSISEEAIKTARQKLLEKMKIISHFYLGMRYSTAREYDFDNAEKSKDSYGVVIDWDYSIIENLLSLNVNTGFSISKRTFELKSSDSYLEHYGSIEASKNFDFLIGFNLETLRLSWMHIGIHALGGLNVSYISVTNSYDDISEKPYYGYKLRGGLSILFPDIIIPFKLVVDYELGRTERILHNGLSAQLLFQVIDF